MYAARSRIFNESAVHRYPRNSFHLPIVGRRQFSEFTSRGAPQRKLKIDAPVDWIVPDHGAVLQRLQGAGCGGESLADSRRTDSGTVSCDSPHAPSSCTSTAIMARYDLPCFKDTVLSL